MQVDCTRFRRARSGRDTEKRCDGKLSDASERPGVVGVELDERMGVFGGGEPGAWRAVGEWSKLLRALTAQRNDQSPSFMF